jgi:undecaprenyl-diphosphatase
MSIIEAIILGIVQGATEFLPVSSSGHSILVPAVLGLREPGLNEVIIAHQGTLLAVLIYFWKDILAIARGFLRGIAERAPLGNSEARLGWYILVGTIPAAVIGLLFESTFEEVFGDPRWAAFFLLITATFLVIGERMLSGKKPVEEMGWVDAMVIGLFQMLALFPGVSRSGSTITGGLLRGLNREVAARYSFLLGIPAIAGAGLLGLVDLAGSSDVNVGSLLVTFVTAAVVGYASIHFLLSWLKQHSLYLFAAYCATVGILYLLYAFLVA